MPAILSLRPAEQQAVVPPPELDLEPFTLGPDDAPVGCLLIHGFTGSPPEMRGLGGYLAERGVLVSGVRLAGHGTQPEELTYLTWRDWLRSASEGLDRLKRSGRKVVVVGFSMGGLLAVHLCAGQPEQVAGLVAISSPIYFRDRRIHLIPLVRHVVRWHRVRRPDSNIDPEARTRYFAYRRYPLIAVDHLLDLMRVTRKVLPTVRTPALIMHGLRDQIIHPRSARYIFNNIASGSKQLVWWRNSGHGVVFDTEREQVSSAVWRFINYELRITNYELGRPIRNL